MKMLAALAVLLVAGFLLLRPYVEKEKMCYQRADSGIDEIGFNIASRGWDLPIVCERRKDILFDLEDCIRTATGSGVVARHADSIITQIVFYARPMTKTISYRKTEHNNECYEYSKFQLK